MPFVAKQVREVMEENRQLNEIRKSVQDLLRGRNIQIISWRKVLNEQPN